jgi:hypothetical protein
MANLIRSPKSGSDWTTNELIAYNITVTAQSPQEFFRRNPEPSLAGVDPSLIDSAVDADNVPDSTFEYLTHLDLATNAGQESFIDDFARETLRILGFAERGLALSTRYITPLTICGDSRRTAQTNVCLLDRRSMILLILQEDKTLNHKSSQKRFPRTSTITAIQRTCHSWCHDYSLHHYGWHTTHLLSSSCHASAQRCGCDWPVPRNSN